MGSSDGVGGPLACVYSSEIGMWGDLISTEVLSLACCGGSASTLIGNVLYWPLKFAMDGILEFDLGRQRLGVIKGPPVIDDTQLHQIIQAEDGALGIAMFSVYSIQMFQRKVNCLGVATWSPWKVVETYNVLGIPHTIYRKWAWLQKFLGYDEDTNAMFLYVVGSVYKVELKPLHFKKLHETSYTNARPCHAFSSFYTPGIAITGGGCQM
uniref:Uncharacterized protein n=2 Tax=Avena sativa TaxID=4498 RepID=A0ACD5VMT1_AVESA